MLDAMFGKADIGTHVEEQIQVLLNIDGDGQLDEDDDGNNFTFIQALLNINGDCQLDEDDDGDNFTFIKYDECQYEPGQERYKCDSKCSSNCRGAFCRYIRDETFDI